MKLKLEVAIGRPKPNHMFPEWLTQRTLFMTFTDKVACAECGKKRKKHWTLVCSFQAKSMAMVVPSASGKVHLPFAAVCTDHLLAPEVVESAEAVAAPLSRPPQLTPAG